MKAVVSVGPIEIVSAAVYQNLCPNMFDKLENAKNRRQQARNVRNMMKISSM